MKNILSELAIVCFFAAADFACFMGMAATPVAQLGCGLAAGVSSVVFVVTLIADAKQFGFTA